MGSLAQSKYVPNSADADRYDELFADYSTLHDHFGRGGNDVMRRLKRIRRDAAPGGTS
jgi:L-ribulokinase